MDILKNALKRFWGRLADFSGHFQVPQNLNRDVVASAGRSSLTLLALACVLVVFEQIVGVSSSSKCVIYMHASLCSVKCVRGEASGWVIIGLNRSYTYMHTYTGRLMIIHWQLANQTFSSILYQAHLVSLLWFIKESATGRSWICSR